MPWRVSGTEGGVTCQEQGSEPLMQCFTQYCYHIESRCKVAFVFKVINLAFVLFFQVTPHALQAIISYSQRQHNAVKVIYPTPNASTKL